MSRKLVSVVTALAMTAGLSVPAFAQGMRPDLAPAAKVEQSGGAEKVACWINPRGARVCNGGGWGGGGAAAAGAIGGLAVGAIIGGAIASSQAQAQANANAQAAANNQQYQQWVAYCSSKYRSFDVQSGTYLGVDGIRHPCQ